MFVNTEKLIWKNGSFENWNESMSIFFHIHYIMELVYLKGLEHKTSNGAAIFRLKKHTNRLFDAASKLELKSHTLKN